MSKPKSAFVQAVPLQGIKTASIAQEIDVTNYDCEAGEAIKAKKERALEINTENFDTSDFDVVYINGVRFAIDKQKPRTMRGLFLLFVSLRF